MKENCMIGAFEKHTKGFGMKYLEMVGYRGGGLGKYEQGIVVPVEIQLKRKKMGIGYTDYKTATRSIRAGKEVVTRFGASEFSAKVEKESSSSSKELIQDSIMQSNQQNKRMKKDYITAEGILVPQVKENLSSSITSKKPVQDLIMASKQGNSNKKTEYITSTGKVEEKNSSSSIPSKRSVQDLVTKVIDMRGPQVKVLTNLANLNGHLKDTDDELSAREEEEEASSSSVTVLGRKRRKKRYRHVNVQKTLKDPTPPMPQLKHNAKKKADMAEADIQKFKRSLGHERESVAMYQKTKELLRRESAGQKQEIDNMENISAELERIRGALAGGTMTLECLARTFENLKSKYQEDYKVHNLSRLASTFALPLLKRLFQNWEPLENPLHGLEVMSLWQRLLQGGRKSCDYGVTSYKKIIMEVILPSVTIAATNSWDPRDPEPMLRFLETWERLLPSSVLYNILDHLVMPKLTDAVDSWHPRRETVPIHALLLPWIPLLGQGAKPLYDRIRYKLGNVLHGWHPRDPSAYAILFPWKSVFCADMWEGLMVCFIIPKLMAVLLDFTINPTNQELDQFYWVIAWESAIPIHHMVAMLEVGFFPMWQHVLYQWLCSGPDFDEVRKWFLRWKWRLPLEFLANERIRSQLIVGLKMMDQAVEGMTVKQPEIRETVSYLRAKEQQQLGVKDNLSYLRVKQQCQFEALQKQQAVAEAAYDQEDAPTSLGCIIRVNNSMAVPQLSLKEVIEVYAQEHDIQFFPKVGRTYDGLQVYGFGTVCIYLDSAKQQVLAQSGDGWTSASLEQLVEMHRGRTRVHP